MIIKAFAQHLNNFSRDIPPIIVLSKWLKDKLSSEPLTNVDKIIHEEIGIAQNKMGLYLLVGKSPTGKNLLEALYNFALSYEQHNFSKWVHDIKASDFSKGYNS